jgi:divalent metal cation (Fe/Co/Zn/Cd) transporter
VVKVIRHFSMHLSPEEIVLQLIIAFREDLVTHELTDAIERIEKKIREAVPIARQIYIQPESIKHVKADRRT